MFSFFSSTKSENRRAEQVLWRVMGFAVVGGVRRQRKGVGK
jgi:hypothetical protein